MENSIQGDRNAAILIAHIEALRIYLYANCEIKDCEITIPNSASLPGTAQRRSHAMIQSKLTSRSRRDGLEHCMEQAGQLSKLWAGVWYGIWCREYGGGCQCPTFSDGPEPLLWLSPIENSSVTASTQYKKMRHTQNFSEWSSITTMTTVIHGCVMLLCQLDPYLHAVDKDRASKRTTTAATQPATVMEKKKQTDSNNSFITQRNNEHNKYAHSREADPESFCSAEFVVRESMDDQIVWGDTKTLDGITKDILVLLTVALIQLIDRLKTRWKLLTQENDVTQGREEHAVLARRSVRFHPIEEGGLQRRRRGMGEPSFLYRLTEIDHYYTPTTKPELSCAATIKTGDLVAGSKRGEIRNSDHSMYSANTINSSTGIIRAKTNLPGYGDPILSIETTENGEWILATCKNYLVVIRSQNNGINGFKKPLGKEKPVLKRLQLSQADIVNIGGQINFTPAKLNGGAGQEKAIVTSTGPYVVTWNSSKIKKGICDAYDVKEYSEDIIGGQFKYRSDKSIAVTTDKNVSMASRNRLIRQFDHQMMVITVHREKILCIIGDLEINLRLSENPLHLTSQVHPFTKAFQRFILGASELRQASNEGLTWVLMSHHREHSNGRMWRYFNEPVALAFVLT
ncbi:WD40-like domain-containing protein [Planoprotostelium fungivorum]|uniref:WD40-like domain-containing protein n=1 Tax=Planoprotostelium fungivorum TaxID=1890364 RepID=A0A2P6MUP1_9EUKA|nr:WD40-like domain-containing protein [Planoprotostelium fungivorum]